MKTQIRTFQKDITVEFDMWAVDELEIETVTIHSLDRDVTYQFKDLTLSRQQFFFDAAYDKAFEMWQKEGEYAREDAEIERGQESAYCRQQWAYNHITQ